MYHSALRCCKKMHVREDIRMNDRTTEDLNMRARHETRVNSLPTWPQMSRYATVSLNC